MTIVPPPPSLGLEKLPDYLSGISEINAVANAQCCVVNSDAIRKKHLCFFRKKTCFFREKKLGLQKKHSKNFCFVLFFEILI